MPDTAQRRKPISIVMLMTLLVSFVLPFGSIRPAPAVAAPVVAAPATVVASIPAALPPTNWCAAGAFQGWNNATTPLNDEGIFGDVFAGDGVYSFRATVPTAGKNEFKAVECGGWSNTFPAQNGWFYTTAANQNVLITFDTNNHSSDAGTVMSPAQNAVHVIGGALPTTWTAVGPWQGWSNNNPATALTAIGNGLYRLAYTVAVPGTYEVKIVKTGDWNTAFTASGRAVDGGGINFTTTLANQQVIFLLDTKTSRYTAKPNGAGAGNWCAAGSFQNPQWNYTATPLYDNGSNGDLLGGDGVFSRNVVVGAPGSYEWKVPACGNWDNAHPNKNSWFLTNSVSQTVKLTFDTNNHANDTGADLIPTQYILNAWDTTNSFTAVGPWQGWSNNNPATLMTQVMSDVYQLSYQIPNPGSYEAKIVTTGNWDGQVVAQGRAFGPTNPDSMTFSTVNLNETVVFYFDNTVGRLRIAPLGDGTPPASEIGDGVINRAAIRHDSRDSLYKLPFGAVTLGTTATLRLRTAAHDVESVKVRVYSTVSNGQSLKSMVKVATDSEGGYDFWEYRIPAQTDLGVLYYRFIISDGATTVYYEDDNRYDGGLGETVNTSGDRSWNIYIYKPDFNTPEWAKNAVIYQIFIERFRNGDTTNDPTANPTDTYPGTTTPTRGWFYPNERGHRFPVTPWNSIVPDPEPYSDNTRPDWATYSSTMYGGDLQGVINKLDYLQDLGVTTLYLNPIFDSPSNHKYDGRDYRTVDPAFGGPTAFAALATAAHARGMYIVLDGVPNHVSSDSPFFDRFGRHNVVGACESNTSPYRAWFFFQDVPAGTGKCASSTGVANGANYTGWFGVETLPQINTAHPEVMSYWFGTPGGQPGLPTNTAAYWVDGNDKADGWRIDVVPDIVGVNPTFFETWRTKMKAANPDAVLYSETWPEGDVRDRVLGDEFDSTMNYRYRKALLGFLRDTRWTDNDGGQEVDPLSPSQFVNAFKTMEEDYPKPAFDAAMNLLGSHDTNRPVHVLNELGFTGTGYDRQPVDGFADARKRLSMVAVLQMTLPGAPTIYYGDEVGLTGYGYDVGRDDPYNRQPYPWDDQAGYNALPEWRKAQTNLLGHYQALGTLRGDHTFLRTGSFDPLLADDENKVLAYGRKDATGAGIVVMNRDNEAHTVALDLATYIPTATTLNQVMPLTMTGTLPPSVGTTYQFMVPANSYGIWITPVGTNFSPPPTPTNLAVTQEYSESVALSWSMPAQQRGGGPTYNIYRSFVAGGGYELVGSSNGTSFTDTDLVAGTAYYYVVKAVQNGIESAPSNEVMAIPHYTITLARLTGPSVITHTISTTDRTEPIGADATITGVTTSMGATPSLQAEIGWGTDGSNPASAAGWHWEPMEFVADVMGGDTFTGTLLPDMVNTFDVAARFTTDNGREWLYADLDGSANGYSTAQAATLIVNGSSDSIAPAAPLNLREQSRSGSQIVIAWTAPANNDVDRYEIYRDNELIATVDAPTTTYTDVDVETGGSYTYKVRAVDGSFNRSPFSNSITIEAEQRNVNVTFRVRVPAETPENDTVYIAGNNAEVFGQQWNPSAQPMTEVAPDLWEFETTALEGTELQYKYTRGAWERVEWWGTIVSVANRSVTVEFGATGEVVIDNTATNWGTGDDSTKAVRAWRDPLVASVSPTAGAINATTPITVVWSSPVTLTGALSQVLTIRNSNGVVIAGTVMMVDDDTFRWTPAVPLPNGEYTATATGVRRADITEPVGVQTPYVWRFRVGPAKIYLPVIYKK